MKWKIKAKTNWKLKNKEIEQFKEIKYLDFGWDSVAATISNGTNKKERNRI